VEGLAFHNKTGVFNSQLLKSLLPISPKMACALKNQTKKSKSQRSASVWNLDFAAYGILR
jgi:hypothetical protein